MRLLQPPPEGRAQATSRPLQSSELYLWLKGVAVLMQTSYYDALAGQPPRLDSEPEPLSDRPASVYTKGPGLGRLHHEGLAARQAARISIQRARAARPGQTMEGEWQAAQTEQQQTVFSNVSFCFLSPSCSGQVAHHCLRCSSSPCAAPAARRELGPGLLGSCATGDWSAAER